MSKIIIAIEYAKQVAEGKIRKDEQISLKELEKILCEKILMVVHTLHG